tara:strand:- start:2095 stop:2289 length:195 start_codon:yes stop_codon:yes gene_type:complete
MIKIKDKDWMKKRIEEGVTFTGAVKLGLFLPVLKKKMRSRIKIPKVNFLKSVDIHHSYEGDNNE